MHENSNSNLRIGYLAPEIPALSATFVYNEILFLKKLGLSVTPFSVHRPANLATERAVSELNDQVVCLYETSKFKVLIDQLRFVLIHPIRYSRALRYLLADLKTLGIFNRSAFGLCYRFYYAARLAKELKKNKVQHLHIHFAHIPTDIGMYAATMAHIPFSVQAHANDLFERGWLLKQKVERSGFFATISEFNQRFLESQGANKSKIEIIRCGVDPGWLAPDKKNHVGFTIGTVGRLVEKKGIDTLIDAAALLKSKGHTFQVVIAGSGPLEINLKQQAYELGLDQTEVQFIGALSHDKVADFISTLDVFVLPCKQDSQGDMDGIPVVLMEAMLCNVPVISTQISGIPELIIHNVSGLLTPPGDAEQLAESIIRLRRTLDLQHQLQKGGQEIVNKKFLLDKNVIRLIELIKANNKNP